MGFLTHYLFVILIFSKLVLSFLPSSQINVLSDIYNTLHGESWSICQWNINHLTINISLPNRYCGLLIDETGNNTHTVYGIYFDFNNNLNGTLPLSLQSLHDLETIYIWYNPLVTGSPPLSLCNLTYLSTIDIYDLRWNGNIPICIAKISSLQFIRLANIPLLSMTHNFIKSLCQNAPNLYAIHLENINYNGSIPDCIGYDLLNLTNIEFNRLNNLYGTVPNSFTNLKFIWELRLKHLPHLTGPFPSNILRNNIFQYFDITKTSLSQTINMQLLCNNTKLIELELENNINIPIEIPLCIYKLINLKIFKLGGSMISGTIPYEICNLKNLMVIQIEKTSMYGTLPKCFSNLSQLITIDLDTNHFSGTFSSIYSSKLVVLDIHSNCFEGNISSIFPLNKYPNLHVIALHNNSFYDEDIGNIIYKIFSFSPLIGGITLYENDYIAGTFPTF
eukprot:300841_1